MAIAIPLIALGSLFVISNYNKSDENDEIVEGFDGDVVYPNDNTDKYYDNASSGHSLNSSNFPIDRGIVNDGDVNKYLNPNQATDKYFKQTGDKVYNRVVATNPPGSAGSGVMPQLSLTGEPLDKNNFEHNNMVPFFGGRVKGATVSGDQAESTLDNMQGGGSQHNHKVEVAPLFKPTSNMQHSNGAPNVSDFVHSRMNSSLKQSNVNPFKSESVAPGLNKGFGTEGGVGFNSGMEARDKWMPKTVDELRTGSNPKVSFDLTGHQGPANSIIKESGTIQSQGKVEQYAPDTYYEVGQDRWFTTTGIQQAPSARSNEIVPDTNRKTTSSEYYGPQATQTSASYTKGVYKKPNRAELKPNDVTNASAIGQGNGSNNDYGVKGYKPLPNNRSTTTHSENVGGVHGIARAVVAPLLDVLRPSRKENVIGNVRPTGNASSSVAKAPIWNPADRTKVTNREMTESAADGKYLNVGRQSSDGYRVNDHQPVTVQRDTTNREYSGIAGPSSYNGDKNYEAAYNQRNNVNKTYESRPNPGGTQIFNEKQNISIQRKDTDRNNNRMWAPNVGSSTIPSKETYGRQIAPTYDNRQNDERINPNLLNAFKENPYTQSLNSWA